MTYDEYLVRERAASERHEFHDGEVFAMAGGTRVHGVVIVNALFCLGAMLRPRGCSVFTSDLRVRTGDDHGVYPDVSALCGPPRFSTTTEDELVNPTLVVEVLSESTERYDRGRKFEHYASIPALRAYVLVATDHVGIELRFRDGLGDDWKIRHFHAGDRVQIDALDVALLVDEIYAGVTLDDGGASASPA